MNSFEGGQVGDAGQFFWKNENCDLDISSDYDSMLFCVLKRAKNTSHAKHKVCHVKYFAHPDTLLGPKSKPV